jgi:hypothetical protein
VAAIELAEWTSANHLRHSKFVALREDKHLNSVVRASFIVATSAIQRFWTRSEALRPSQLMRQSVKITVEFRQSANLSRDRTLCSSSFP